MTGCTSSVVEGPLTERSGRTSDQMAATTNDSCWPILLKKSLCGFCNPLAKKTTSQIGLQTARGLRLRVRRPLQTSRKRRSATFSNSIGRTQPFATGAACAILPSCESNKFASQIRQVQFIRFGVIKRVTEFVGSSLTVNDAQSN